MSASSWKILTSLAIAVIVVVSAFGLIGVGAGPSAPAHSTAAAPAASAATASASSGVGSSNNPANGVPLTVSPTRQALVAQAYKNTVANGNLALFEPPNLNQAPSTTLTGNHIVPLYNYAPAPLGVSTFGLENTSGTITPYILRTTSLEGTFSTSDPLGVQTTSPYFSSLQSYGAQLNTVLVNTTVYGQSIYFYWLQNVINYNPTTSSLSFENNIWNFSSPSGIFPSQSILHGNGRILSSEYYAVSGPSVTIAYPFTLDLYLNTTVGSYSGSPMVNEVYFNYSVFNSLGQHVCPATEPSGEVCGSYDNVYFNSKVTVAPGTAQIEANGYQYNPLGLPTDMEMDWGIGTSSGANANINYANATVGIYAWNATAGRYLAPPSTYDFGSETGETTTGAYGTWSVAANGVPMEHFRTGPGLLIGLWNASGLFVNTGQTVLNYAHIAPGNAFIAIAAGGNVTNQSYFQVAPTIGWFAGRGSLGKNIYLQPGVYTIEVMLTGYDWYNATLVLTTPYGASPTITLVRDPASTVYTPLWAFSSQDLANLSVSGSGTLGNPYVLPDYQQGTDSLEPVFATLNDYLFIVWTGVWINGTTAYAVMDPAPSLYVAYPTWWYFQLQTLADAYGQTPYYNQLPFYLYHAQNVTIAHATSIGLWSSDIEVGHNYAMYINAGKNDLVYDNYFNVSSEGLDILGGTGTSHSNNYVWGNTFFPYSNPGWGGVSAPSTGLAVADSGDHIYNNAFYTNSTATASSTYTDFWNATGGYQPASNVVMVNGYALTGSILGQNFQGGNYWFNEGATLNPYGLPYVNYAVSRGSLAAAIGKGGDYAPLIPYMTQALASTVPNALGSGIYEVNFASSGLITGNPWSIRLLGVPVYQPLRGTSYLVNIVNATTVTATISTQHFYAPNGTYNWVLLTKPANSLPVVSSGTLNVTGAEVTVSIVFQWTITFTETGLPANTEWATVLAGKLQTSTATSIVYTVNAGTYSFGVASVAPGWTANRSAGSISVAGGAATVPTTFTSTAAVPFAVYFTESGLASGATWQVWVNSTDSGSNYHVTGSTATLSVMANPDSYTYKIGVVSGYSATPSSGSFVVTTSALSYGITFSPVTYTVTFTESGLPLGTAWGLTFGTVFHWSTASTISFNVVPGTYSWTIAVVTGYPSNPTTGMTTIVNSGASVMITFT